MANNKLRILIFLLILLNHTVWAQRETTKAGTAAAQFLKIGIGARVQAMAGAGAGLHNNMSALYWNPAGIAHLRQKYWQGTHTQWLADVTHQFTGLVLPVGRRVSVGFSAIIVNMDEEEITTIQHPQGTGLYWDASDLAVGLSGAIQLTDRFSVGLTAKYIYQKIYHETAATMAVDVGTLLETGLRGLSIGMCFSNFGGDLQLDGRDLIRSYDPNKANSRNDPVDARLQTEPWALPVNFRLGIAFNLLGQQKEALFYNRQQQVLFAVDANHPNDAAENIRIGLEYTLYKLLSLRMGYKINEDLVKFTVGGGLNFNLRTSRFSLDYALATYGELEYVNFVSLGCTF